MIPVAILAGGLATRLRPVTRTLPKSLIPVAGEPFIAHQLRQLQREGVERVVLCLGYLGEAVRDVVGDGAAFGLKVDYSFDGPTLLGTGGALRRALPLLEDTFFVLYGDSYLDIAYDSVLQAFRRSRAPALMTVFKNNGQWDTSNILFDGHRVTRYDKWRPTPDMRYIDYGLSVITARLLTELEDDKGFDLTEVLSPLAAQGHLAGYEATRRFFEIGTPEGLAETDAHLRGA
jgi:NDP-sugar pyrophosphorylase family protein